MNQKEKHKAWAAILNAALTKLWDGERYETLQTTDKTAYICYAIGTVSNSSEARSLQKEIHRRLYPNQSLTSWLLFQHNVKDVNAVKFQKHRKDWMLLMIEEFSS